MFFSINKGLYKNERTFSIENSNFEAYWEGVIFQIGVEEGANSVLKFIETLSVDESDLSVAKKSHSLKGNYSIFIKNISNNSWIFFTDHSHQQYVYYSSEGISNSFLSLKEHHSSLSLSEEGMISILSSGYLYNGKTIFEELSILDYRKYIHIENNKIVVKDKQLEFKIFEPQESDFVETLDSLYAPLASKKVSLDLTGGTDSRTIVVTLTSLGYKFDVATNGDQSYSEVVTAKRIAEMLNHKHIAIGFKPSDILADDLINSWKSCDGLGINLGGYLYENFRKNYGYELCIGSSGGELYKDGGWFRYALPLRNKPKNKAMGLFIRTTLENGMLHWGSLSKENVAYYLTKEYQDRYNDYCHDRLKQLTDEYKDYPVFEGADRLFIEYSTNTPRGNGININQRFQPLFEPEMINIGVTLSMFKRINHLFYRRNMTKLNPAIAAVETDRQRLTISSKPGLLLRDYFRYAFAGYYQKLSGSFKKVKNINKNNEIINGYMRSHPDTTRAVQYAKSMKMLNPTIEIININQKLMDTIISLYYLAN